MKNDLTTAFLSSVPLPWGLWSSEQMMDSLYAFTVQKKCIFV